MAINSLRNPTVEDLDWLNHILLNGEMLWPENRLYRERFIELYALKEKSFERLILKIVQVNGRDIGFFALKDNELLYFYMDTIYLNQGYGRIMWELLKDYMIHQGLTYITFEASLSLKGFYEHMGAHIIDKKVSSLSSKKFNYVFQYTI